MFEKKESKLLPKRLFIKRVRNSLLTGSAIMLLSLGVGMLGYQHYEKMSWVDAYVNAAMILSGMGPVGNLQTDGGKIFAGSYALFSGIVFLVAAAVVFAPILHRFIHTFHLEE